MPYEYQFPEKEPFRAKEVTEPEFYIQSREDWFGKLWVDFSEVRKDSRFDRMKFDLGMIKGEVKIFPNDYVKIIFSGHRGCGKSVELKRFAKEVNKPEAFFLIMIDLEQATSIEQLAPEDIFIVIISMLIKELTARKVPFEKDDFSDISKEWMSDTEVQNEIENTFGAEAEAKATIGWSFWKFFGIEGNLKGVYARNNTTTKTVRQKIKNNPKPLLTKLNAALVSVRNTIRKKGFGQDLLFIIDGLEKANSTVYEALFVKDVQMITGIQAHIITTVPISTFYEILHLPSHDYFRDFYLPMVRVNKQSWSLLEKLVFKRVDKSLIAKKAMDLFIEKSGGCPRILLKLINRAIVNALGDKVTLEIAEEVVILEGNERWRALTGKHKEILRTGNFDSADKEVFELLQSLNLLEYNGLEPERKINPLIGRFFSS